MEAQTLAEGIYSNGSYPDAEYFAITCTCGRDEHKIQLALEKDVNELTIRFETVQNTDWWTNKFELSYVPENPWLYTIVYQINSFVNGLMNRLSLTKQLWIHGHIKYYSTTILTKQQALNFSKALENGIARLEHDNVD